MFLWRCVNKLRFVIRIWTIQSSGWHHKNRYDDTHQPSQRSWPPDPASRILRQEWQTHFENNSFYCHISEKKSLVNLRMLQNTANSSQEEHDGIFTECTVRTSNWTARYNPQIRDLLYTGLPSQTACVVNPTHLNVPLALCKQVAFCYPNLNYTIKWLTS